MSETSTGERSPMAPYQMVLREVGRIIMVSPQKEYHSGPDRDSAFGVEVNSAVCRGKLPLYTFFLYAESWSDEIRKSYMELGVPPYSDFSLPGPDTVEGIPSRRLFAVNRDGTIDRYDDQAELDENGEPIDWSEDPAKSQLSREIPPEQIEKLIAELVSLGALN